MLGSFSFPGLLAFGGFCLPYASSFPFPLSPRPSVPPSSVHRGRGPTRQRLPKSSLIFTCLGGETIANFFRGRFRPAAAFRALQAKTTQKNAISGAPERLTSRSCAPGWGPTVRLNLPDSTGWRSASSWANPVSSPIVHSCPGVRGQLEDPSRDHPTCLQPHPFWSSGHGQRKG